MTGQTLANPGQRVRADQEPDAWFSEPGERQAAAVQLCGDCGRTVRVLSFLTGCVCDRRLAGRSARSRSRHPASVALVSLGGPSRPSRQFPADLRRRGVFDLIQEGKAGCALCSCALERPPLTTPASVAAFTVFAGPKTTDRYIGLGICLQCTAEPGLAERLIKEFRIEELPAGHC